jgi:hypothetical protein
MTAGGVGTPRAQSVDLSARHGKAPHWQSAAQFYCISLREVPSAFHPPASLTSVTIEQWNRRPVCTLHRPYYGVIKQRRIRWTRHVARLGYIRYTYKILVGLLLQRTVLKWILKNEGEKVLAGFNWLRLAPVTGFSEHGNWSSGALGRLSNCVSINSYSAQWS